MWIVAPVPIVQIVKIAATARTATIAQIAAIVIVVTVAAHALSATWRLDLRMRQEVYNQNKGDTDVYTNLWYL